MTPLSVFADLPEDMFPVTVEYYTVDGVVVRTDTIDRPGAYVVPPLGEKYGPIGVKVTSGDGHVQCLPPPPERPDA